MLTDWWRAVNQTGPIINGTKVAQYNEWASGDFGYSYWEGMQARDINET